MDTQSPVPVCTELTQRLRQQELVAAFGLFALRGRSLQPVLDEACRVAAQGLETRLAKVLRFEPARGDFLMVAGIGWRPGLLGHARMGADLASPAGYAFRTGQPVLSNHLSAEDRFRTPAIMVEHGVTRAINVLIGGGDAPAFGVLEVDSGDRTDFETRDTAFLQSLANVIAAAVERDGQEAALVGSEALARRIFESSPDCLKVLDADGTLRRMNQNGLCLLELDHSATVEGAQWEAMWPFEQRDMVREAVRAARAGGTGHFEAFCPTAKGTPRWWDVTVSPVAGEDGQVEKLVSVSRDITRRVQDSEAKDALLREKDLLMQEVHHRVRNSLQLVHTLLQLQLNQMSDSAARRPLTEAARRVLTVAAVHKQLYTGQSVSEADVLPYLTGLLDELGRSLTDQAGERSIELDAEPALLSSACLTSLGLVVAELVTNALKYGRGRVTVTVRLVGGTVQVAVGDEGQGFPQDFDPARSRGLGMRLVIAMAKGARAIEVDRGSGRSRITVNLPRT